MKTLLFSLLLLCCALSGRSQSQTYYKHINYRDGYADVSSLPNHGQYSKHGIMDSTFKQIVPERYETFWRDDFEAIFKNHKTIGKRGKVYDLINDKGEIEQSNLTEEEAAQLYNVFAAYPNTKLLKNNYTVRLDSNAIKTVIDPSGKIIFQGRYYYFNSGIGNQFIATIFDSTNHLQNEVILDSLGNDISNGGFKDIHLASKADFYWVGDHKLYRPVNKNLEPISDFTCSRVHVCPSPDTYWVQIGKKWGLINSRFEFILPPTFEDANPYTDRDTISLIDFNGRAAFFHNNGTQLSDFIYNTGYMAQFSGDYISIDREDVGQMLDNQLKCIYNCDSTYDVLKFDDKNKLYVKGKIVGFKKEGEWLYYFNGKLNVKEYYTDGLLQGRKEQYNVKGELESVLYYDCGRIVDAYTVTKKRKGLFKVEYIEEEEDLYRFLNGR